MVRAPCCDQSMGLKKGPWTSQEDHLLISYIQQYGHSNWRALPKQAGLLRCGKSCRLRWTNYLRPGIKRGNFTNEEEDTIIHLHEKLGNRWSAIAARLPGRTDNEIKNIWHTHIKKKLKNHQPHQSYKNLNDPRKLLKPENPSFCTQMEIISDPGYTSISPRSSCSEMSSSVTELSTLTTIMKQEQINSSEISISFPEIDENFWSEELLVEDSTMQGSEFWSDEVQCEMINSEKVDGGVMEFWYKVLIRTGGLPELPEL